MSGQIHIQKTSASIDPELAEIWAGLSWGQRKQLVFLIWWDEMRRRKITWIFALLIGAALVWFGATRDPLALAAGVFVALLLAALFFLP